ncbi:LysR substrate-binding domain-containing protein [Neptunomonas sp. XY-337]|uniref:LysR substrate-binding domain-containing protein n=1 Tax=Neptunomonas sp. XY-337 TaxID=2561897 RepID=UPI00145BBA52|nr:LysR substrate-binding domain-containing protein [Neptunomonas sp. XY-337]
MKVTARILSSLPYFEAVGRLGSVSQAAMELCVTPGAVSQQIRKLEGQLDTALFRRSGQRLVLSEAGRAFLLSVQGGFTEIERGCTQLQALNHAVPVRLRATPSFAYKYLIPKLALFHEQYPDIAVETHADTSLHLESGRPYDLAIDYCLLEQAPNSGTLLFEEKLIPVASPHYFAQLPDQEAFWRSAALLHDGEPWQHASRDAEWAFWLQRHGISEVSASSGHYFNRSDMALAAAVAGLGVALARQSLVQEELAQGSLITLAKPVSAPCGYYLLEAGRAATKPHALALASWLQETAIA